MKDIETAFKVGLPKNVVNRMDLVEMLDPFMALDDYELAYVTMGILTMCAIRLLDDPSTVSPELRHETVRRILSMIEGNLNREYSR